MKKNNPLYKKLADELIVDIRSKSVGDFLPAEVDLAGHYQVSRFTVRKALDILAEQGLIDRVKRRGTQIVSLQPIKKYEQKLDGIDTVLAFAGQSRMYIEKVKLLGARDCPDEIRDLGDKTDSWLRLEGVRRLVNDADISTWTCIYVPGRFVGIQSVLPPDLDSVYELIEQIYEVRVHQVEHLISACTCTAKIANKLSLRVGSPVLKVQAKLCTEDGSLIEFVESMHKPDKLSLSITTTRLM